MTFDDFIIKYLGMGIDYDNSYGVQCVDLIKLYMDKVLNVKPRALGNAHAYFDNFYKHDFLTKNFILIYNDPDFIPRKGDIGVFSKQLRGSGGCGHIVICDGVGTTKYFYSYDQNATGNNDPCARVRHNYTHFLGVLRPRKFTNIDNKTVPKIGDVVTLKYNVNVRWGAGTKFPIKGYSEITENAKENCTNYVRAVLKSGTKCTIQATKIVSGDLWAKIPSGWICLKYNNMWYIK